MACVIHRLYPINDQTEFSTGRVRETPHPLKRRERFLHEVCKTETPTDKRPFHLVGVDFLLHAPCWNLSGRSVDGECLLHAPVINSVLSFVGWGVCAPHAVLESVSSFLVSGEFLLHAQSWNLSDRSTGWESLFYTPCWNLSRCFGKWEVSLTHCNRTGICGVILRVGSFSYTPHARICLFVRRVGSFSFTFRAGVGLSAR